ncbi:MAG: alpha/beta hydrolase [Anaerolineae bacterium]|nr:alpha/beta hydrolase [Anaerolineae bacterium]MBT7072300.1 alpha/beta hydrolase [Anaerolineae bacterium]MBT7326117.1 alpha/beta hydrolase [Anaerolineae bacterium]MBT7601782.1 alpha/beta hydrolase [Anaerolineae bacterium]
MLNYEYVETNGIRLHVAQAGSDNDPLIILLHGFPEFSYGWRKQIPYLVEAGYRVWAPDQRGYNLSDKPDGLASYSIDILAADVIGLIDAAGEKQVFLVGHDWGAAVAWRVAAKYPERLKKLIILNVPHGDVLKKNLLSSFAQLLKSWYIFFFQIPWLPEMLAKQRDWKMVAESLTKSSRPETFTENDLGQYRQAWSEPKAYKSMLNWYRAMLQRPPKSLPSPRIIVPTLLIWGAKDKFLGREMAQPSIDLCDDGRLVFIEEATHWVQHEEAERVNKLIGSFLCEEEDD